MLKTKKNKGKKNEETLQRHRFGSYELRISESKVEIEDIVNKMVKHVYSVGGYEHGLLSFPLSQVKATPEGVVAKTDQEIKDGISNVEIIVYMLAYTNLIFSNEEFREEYYDLVKKYVTKATAPVEISKEDDDAILKELEVVEQMKEVIEGVE